MAFFTSKLRRVFGALALGLMMSWPGLATASPEVNQDDTPLRVLVLVNATNLDEQTQLVEARLAKEIAARGYVVRDRTAVGWAQIRASLAGAEPGSHLPWIKQLVGHFDLLLAGEARAVEGRTPPALARAGMVSVQARVKLRLYEVANWSLLDAVAPRGAAAHISEYTAGELALEKALKGVTQRFFAQPPVLTTRIVREAPDAAGAETGTGAVAAREGVVPPGGASAVAAEPAVQVASELLADLPVASTPNPDAFALVIGNRNYLKIKNVDFAINDASLMKQYLMRILGYKEGNIFFVTDATKGDLELYLGTRDNHQGKLYNAVKPDRSDVFVYYAGHGAPGLRDRAAYFVPVDADPNYVELQGYATDIFYDNLAHLPARSVTVVIDACFSGANYEGISPVAISFDNPVMRVPNTVVYSSSQGTQASAWYDEKGHGLFTYLFAAGIRGLAADGNGDGVLTYEELFRFVSDRSEGVPYYARLLHNVDQTPTLIKSARDTVFLRR